MTHASSHRWFVLSVVVAIAVLLTPIRAIAAGEITYNLIDSPEYYTGFNFPGGWNLNGTITTDGNTGLLTTSDIVAWSWTTTNGTYTYSATSSQSGTSTSTNGIYATTTYLALPMSSLAPGGGFGYGMNLISTIPPPAPYTQGGLQYQLSDSWLGANELADAMYWTTFSETPIAPWWTDGIGVSTNEVTIPTSVPYSGGNAWEFATAQTTPEPASFTLLATALLGLVWFFFVHRRPRAASQAR